jgi:hypothetical protein
VVRSSAASDVYKRQVEHYAKYDSKFKGKAIDATDRRPKHCIEVADQPVSDGGSIPATR